MKLRSIITVTLLFVLLILNPFTWLYFFDHDGLLSLESKIILLIIDLFIIFFILMNYRYGAKVLLFNIFFSGIIIFVFELKFGNWMENYNIEKLSIPYMNSTYKFSVKDLYPWDEDYVIYRRDKYGFRSKYESVEDIDILTIGGSTVDQIYISEGYTFQDVMQREFQNNGKSIDIVNAGIDGHSTVGHIIFFDYWFGQIPNFRPKYILVYVGGNDFYNVIFSERIKNFKNFRMQGSEGQKGVINYIRLNSISYHFIRTIIGFCITKNNFHGYVSFDFQDWTDELVLENPEVLLKIGLQQYQERLFELSNKIINFGSKPIFVSHSARRSYDFVDGTLLGMKNFAAFDGHNINGTDYFKIMEIMHGITEKVAKDVDAIYLNLFEELSFDLNEDFYDPIHTTPKGSEKIGKYIFEQLNYLF